ncbi:Zinc finger C-x8-C-x5-C-x3-H type (and similar) [Seminavis robusta]|uniref:Zinc finger C-x8-C-x5-C-x3-H type (And similar) n=1 Tax=Seminavis robusta TaxID=568900 RepID=A0A9N8DAV4_9STRA|nr:Zinc finger C-x8-C-x5-C-x3-H type (and similar) [Seminavis robusta]|eukprot:Sro4_g003140.1 Zinc finger C-x8-C-x5-C-x3-H type (and similar) (987) ;mRNA; r:54719-57679
MSCLRATASEFNVGTASTTQARAGRTSPPFTRNKLSSPLSVAAGDFIPGVGCKQSNEIQSDTTQSSDQFRMAETISREEHLNGVFFHPPNVLLKKLGTRPESLDASAACFTPKSHNKDAETVSSEGISTAKPICRFFQQGSCRRGLQCNFSHDINALPSTNDASQHNSRHQQDTTITQPQVDNKGTSLLTVDNGIRCHFGRGLEVLNLELGSMENNSTQKDSKRILVSGLSESTSDYDLEGRLSVFGTILFIQRKKPSYAFCTYESNQEASAAIESLNGTPLTTWTGLSTKPSGKSHQKDKKKKRDSTGFVSVSIVREGGQGNNPTRHATVRLQWYAPSRVAWLHFHNRCQADKVAKTCNGQLCEKRKVSAKMQQPKFNQTRSFSVWVGGLGEGVHTTKLSQFVKKHSGAWPASIDLEAPSYRDKDGAQLMRSLLIEQGGPLTQFDEDEGNNRFASNLKRKALAKFAKAEDASRACEFFQQTSRVAGLGGTKVHCQMIFSAKFTMPTSHFKIVQGSLVDLCQKEDLRHKVFYNANGTSSLLVQADDAKQLARAKIPLTDTVGGMLLLDPECKGGQKVPMWKDCFRSRETEMSVTQKIVQRFGHLCVAVLIQRRRREVRLYVKPHLKQQAVDFVTSLLCTLKGPLQAVPIGPERYKFLLVGGRETMDTLIAACHGIVVSLDVKNQSLLVEGSRSDARRAVSCLKRMMEIKETSGRQEDQDGHPCPVCFCVPEDSEESPIVELSCCHRYCGDCFLAWVCGGTQTCTFPICCLADGCDKGGVELDVLERILPRQDFLGLLRSAVDKHVVSHPTEFQFCLSPGCSGVYMYTTGSSRTSSCSTCQMVVCCPCQAQDHEGLTCEQSKLAKLPPDRLRNHIVEEILTLKCPRCKQAFLDFEGCFALTCSSCRCAFCGWCLQDCGKDAHAHVKTCTAKLNRETYFGTIQEFQQAQRKRRRQDLKNFLKSLSENEKQAALKAIEQDLKDLKLQPL